MKTLLTTLLLIFALSINAQDTTYTIKSINKDRCITGYLIISVFKDEIVKTERIDSYIELERLNLRKNAKARVYLNEVPRDYLKQDEYLKNGVRDNSIK